ncbi:MAG: helix-turn-helix transcriptional regulator [Candidatus Latescibacterota bacterium]|nr:MAG: helix-turn-helix transcriptional regulator [Candidatus Latescibacterota bacterium]
MSDTILNKVREYRRGAKLTQEDLGRAVGVSRQTIISIERGKYIPSLPLALKIAAYFGCSTDEMFKLEEVIDRG